jgi:outer membrane protein insertion porin family
MNGVFRLLGLFATLLLIPSARAQIEGGDVHSVEIRHVGPAAASDALILSHIRVKPGDKYIPTAVDDDVHNLYATALFYNIRVAPVRTNAGNVALFYVLQGKPRLTSIKYEGNEKFKDGKLEKKITSKVGEPLDERKLFTDKQTIIEMYQKAGYPGTQVEYVINIDEVNGRGTVTFEVKEGFKVKIIDIQFVGAQAFTQKKLRKAIKTRKKWMFTWLTQRGVYKEEKFEDDRELLTQFYRNNGYIDFEIKEVEFQKPTDRTMLIRIHINEGRQYKVGSVSFEGVTMFPTNTVEKDFQLKPGAIFAPSGLGKDVQKVEDFYGSKGHIDVTTAPPGNLRARRVPNIETGTMDIQYVVKEGEVSYVEKIEIRGNAKTKDRVIRRELAISPGEPFDMVRVRVSKQRLEGLQYFEKVELEPDPTDVPNRKNLIVGVEEKSTGNLSFGAGFNSVESVVGFAEVSQGNFDLFNPPTFTGAGQKFRLRVQLGTERQDYVLTFVEPWFLGRKLALGVDAYHRELNFQSVENLYDESRTGVKLSLTKALGSDFLLGSLSFTVENVGIDLDSSLHYTQDSGGGNDGNDDGDGDNIDERNAPLALLDEDGSALLLRFGGSLAYDTRNSTRLPDSGQRTELFAEIVNGDKEFYKAELKSAWYFRPYFKGHVIEVAGRVGVVDSLNGGNVPFYERWYLGGLYSLRGFEYRDISPREANPEGGFFEEPIGGNSYWFGTLEYSLPVFQTAGNVGVRFALFYDIGSVKSDAFDFDFDNYSDNWGLGLRLNLPIGPLRLDYGIPINHDQFSSGSGRFQFGVGYQREF